MPPAPQVERRTFLISLALAPLALGCGVADEAPRMPTLGPYLCDPRADAMGFFVEGPVDGGYVVKVSPTSGDALTTELTLDAQGRGRADVYGLTPGTDYAYALLSHGTLVAEGAFRTLPEGRASSVRLAIGADIHWESKPYGVFDRIRELSPDALLMIGDQVYADRGPSGTVAANEAAYRELYRTFWDDQALADCWADVPTLLMWDDHEIINDYSGADPARFVVAGAAFRAYQGARNPPPLRGGVHYFATSLGPVDVFVLDTRSYRDDNALPDGPEKTMLGAAQRVELEDFLRSSTAPVKLVVSPTPFGVLPGDRPGHARSTSV